MLAKIQSLMLVGVDGCPLDIEVDISRGLPMFATVGLPDGAVRESRERVKAAIRNSGYEFPNRRITVNLAPADLKKEGTGYDLPIALGILGAGGLIDPARLAGYAVLGELSLDGAVRSVRGVLPMAAAALEMGLRGILVPYENRREAAVVNGLEVIAVSWLSDAVRFFSGEADGLQYKNEETEAADICTLLDYADVKGQEHAKRALEIAAAGNHNIIMKGPPGAGKTMLAQRLPTILPVMSFQESIETTKIYSTAGLLSEETALLRVRPFRAPHHSISDAGLVGGGSFPRPGEISLAHNGVLFLDELTEFRKGLLEMLRQPLEEKRVHIARVAMTLSYPADFLLVAAYNPCPCGMYGAPSGVCTCLPQQIQRYLAKLSGPLLDRMDLHIEIPPLEFGEMSASEPGSTSAEMRDRVLSARSLQGKRFADYPHIRNNSMMSAREVDIFCVIDADTRRLLEKSMERMHLSARGYHRILKISRTIADLDGAEAVTRRHVAEALQYRRENPSALGI